MNPQNPSGRDGVHFDDEALLAYVEGTAPDATVLQIEDHFPECADCLRRATKLRRASAILGGWTASRHAFVIEALAVEMALRSAGASAANMKWRERLDRWRTAFGSHAQAAARVGVEASRMTLNATRELKSLLVPGGWEWIPAAMARSNDVSVLEIRGADLSRLAVTEERLPGGGTGRVLTLTLPQSLTGDEPYLVMVVNTSEPEQVAIQETRSANGSITAVFRGLPAGQYIVVVEPGGAK